MRSEHYSHKPDQLEAHSQMFLAIEQISDLQTELQVRLIGKNVYDSARQKLDLEDSIIGNLNEEEKTQLYEQQKKLMIDGDYQLLTDPDIEALDRAVELIGCAGREAIGDVDGFKPVSIEPDHIDLLRIEQFESVNFLQVITLNKYYPHRQLVTQNRPTDIRIIAGEDMDLPAIAPLDFVEVTDLIEQMSSFYAGLSQLDDVSFERWRARAVNQFDI